MTPEQERHLDAARKWIENLPADAFAADPDAGNTFEEVLKANNRQWVEDLSLVLERVTELEGQVRDAAHRLHVLKMERDVFEELLGGPTRVVDADDVADAIVNAVHGPRPEWPRLLETVRDIEATIGDDFGTRAQIDRNGAWIRDVYDGQGLSIAHEDTLYVSIIAQTVLVEMCGNLAREGKAPVWLDQLVAQLARTFLASVIDHLPAEAKG